MFLVKSFSTFIAVAALSTVAIGGAQAAERHFNSGYGGPGDNFRVAMVNRRISNQRRRIRRGRRSGRIDRVEAYRLRFELSHIRGFRSRYMRDGWLSRFENRHLHGLLNQNSRRIRRMASNSWGWRNRDRGRVSDRFDDRDFGRDRPRRRRISGLNGFE